MTVGGLDLVTRPTVPSDRGYIGKSWYLSYEKHAQLPATVYAEHYRAVIDACLDAGTTLVLVPKSTPSLIVGFVCGDATKGYVAYAYVRSEARGEGLCRLMVTELLGSYPARIPVTSRLPWPSHRFYFDPFCLGILL